MKIIKKITARIISIGLSAAMILILFSGCVGANNGEGYAFSYSLTSNPKNLDPQVATDNNSLLVLRNMFEGLMRLDKNGDLINGVAERVDPNDAFTEYTFYLRKDTFWSSVVVDTKKTTTTTAPDDGEPTQPEEEIEVKIPVTAHDFAFAWKRALDPLTGSTTASALYCIRGGEAFNNGTGTADALGITVIDEYTLKVTLEYPFSEFPLQTTLAVFMPCNQEFFESTKGHYGLDDLYIIANGPFCFGKHGAWNHDNWVRIIRNENYKGENRVLPSVLYLGIRKSDVDYFDLLENTVEAAKIEPYNVYKLDKSGYIPYSFADKTIGLAFNTDDYVYGSGNINAFSNVNVRLAFIKAITTESYESFLSDGHNIASDIIPSATKLNGVRYRDLVDERMKIASDPENALQQLKTGLTQMGMPKMQKVTIIYPESEEHTSMLHGMLKCWENSLKEYVNLEPVPESDLKTRISLGQYQVALCNISPTKDGPLACLQMFRPGAAGNPSMFNDQAFNAMVDQAAAKTNTQDILQYLVAAEKFLNNQAVFFPLYYDSTYYATWPTVDGIYFSPFDGTADFLSATCTK